MKHTAMGKHVNVQVELIIDVHNAAHRQLQRTDSFEVELPETHYAQAQRTSLASLENLISATFEAWHAAAHHNRVALRAGIWRAHVK